MMWLPRMGFGHLGRLPVVHSCQERPPHESQVMFRLDSATPEHNVAFRATGSYAQHPAIGCLQLELQPAMPCVRRCAREHHAVPERRRL